MSLRSIRRLESEIAASVSAKNLQERHEEVIDGSTQSEDSSDDNEHSSLRGVGNRFDLLSSDSDLDTEDHSPDESNAVGTSGESKSREPPLNAKSIKHDDGVAKAAKRNRKRKKNARKHRTSSDTRDKDVLPDKRCETQDRSSCAESGDHDEDLAVVEEYYFATEDSEELRNETQTIMKDIVLLAYPDGITPRDFEASVRAAYELISINRKFLNADAELKQLFGSRVVENERREDAALERRHPQSRYTQRPSRSRNRVLFAHPRQGWPCYAPGLSMSSDDGSRQDDDCEARHVRYYRYTYDKYYRAVQDEFHVCVASNDPNMLIALLRSHPYHVDTLLQLSEIFQRLGEPERAGEFIERAIVILETSWHRAFKPYEGNCRLSFSVPENRSLYRALMAYSQLLKQRGLHRTALECAKLLLNFDPYDDPMGVLLCLDSIAFFSSEHEWLKAMHLNYHFIPLEYFPNFALSSGCAASCLTSNEGSVRPRRKRKSFSSGTPLSCNSAGVSKTPLELTSEALLTYPMALSPILKAIKVEQHEVLRRFSLFRQFNASAMSYGDKTLLRICRVYAEKSKDFWSLPAYTQLLLDGAQKAGELAEGRCGVQAHHIVEECAQLRAEATRFFDDCHLYSDTLFPTHYGENDALPAGLMQEDIDGRLGDQQQLVGSDVRQTRQGTITNVEALVAFLESILPWRDATSLADRINSNSQN